MEKWNKKKIIALITVVAVVFIGIGAFAGYRALHKANKSTKDAVTIAGRTLTAEEEAQLDAEINQVVDEYLAEFSKQKAFSEIMTDEDKSALGRDILTELSKDMSDEELTMMKEILVDIFSDDSTLTITGSAYFTEETKAYINQNIRTAVKEAISGYSAEGSESNTELRTAVERIVTETINSTGAGYTLSSADMDNLRQSVISSIGATGAAGNNGADGKDGVNGKDGADGKNGENGKDGEDGEDGKDGRDGRDGAAGANGKDGADGKNGADGYTPVKGTDYFTEKEIDSIINTITTQTEKYVDTKEVDSVAQISTNLQKNLTDVFNAQLQKATEEYQVGISNLDSKLTEEINVNVTTLEETISTLESTVNTRLDEVVSTVNEKLAEVSTTITDTLNTYKADFDAKIANLSQETNERIDTLSTDTDSKIDSMKSVTDERLQNLSDSTDAKLKEITDGEATFELVKNSDGTYTLKITDPKNQ